MNRKMKRTKSLKSVNYNAGDIAWYRKQLLEIVREMNDDVKSIIIPIFAENQLAMDANPVKLLRHALQSLSKKWVEVFAKKATPTAESITNKTGEAVDRRTLAAARQQAMTVQMQWTDAMLEKREAIIAENVSLIRSIPEKYFTEVEGMVFRAVAKGGARKELADEIETAFGKRYGITRRRAEFIASDQVRKATSALSIARQQAQGIKKGIWIHSCGGNEPRPKHVHANGQEFDLDKGLPIGDKGQYVLPGEEPGCGCTWKPILPF